MRLAPMPESKEYQAAERGHSPQWLGVIEEFYAGRWCLDWQLRKIHLSWVLASLETGRPIRSLSGPFLLQLAKLQFKWLKVECLSSLTTGRADVLWGLRNT